MCKTMLYSRQVDELTSTTSKRTVRAHTGIEAATIENTKHREPNQTVIKRQTAHGTQAFSAINTYSHIHAKLKNRSFLKSWGNIFH